MDQAPAFNPDDFDRMVLGSSTTGGTTEGAGREMLTGALEAVAETGAPLGTGLLGLKLGTALGGPVVGAPIGLGAGLLTGWLMGEQAKKTLPPPPPEGSPLRVGTKFFADSLMTAPLAFGFAPASASAGRLGTLIGKIGESARTAPGAYLSAEAIMGLGSGIGAGIGEGINPGDPLAQAGGGLVGGLSFQLPATVVQNAITNISPSLIKAANPVPWITDFQGQKKAVTDVIRERQQKRAVNAIYKLLEENKEDIPALIRSLEAPGLEGVPNLTAAQKTGSKTLAAMQARLAIGSDSYKPETLQQSAAAFMAMQTLVKRLEQTGDPAALQAAAQVRKDTFDQMIKNRLFAAEAQAASKASAIAPTDKVAREGLADVYRDQVQKAYDEIRKVEKVTWDSAFSQLGREASTWKQAALERKAAELGLSLDEATRLRNEMVNNPSLMENAQRSLDDIRQGMRGLTGRIEDVEAAAKSQFDRFTPYRNAMSLATLIDRPAAEFAEAMPSSAALSFLERVQARSEAGFDALPSDLRNTMADLGITKDAFLRYKQGTKTAEYLETGRVPFEYLPKLQPVHVMDLWSDRSRLLAKATEARASGQTSLAGTYGRAAGGLLDDINRLESPLLAEPTALSRSFNDAFTRTFANDVRGVDRTGADRLSGEEIISRLRRDTSRMEEVTQAIEFPRKAYEDALSRLGPDDELTKRLQPLAKITDESLPTLANAQRSILLGAAAKSLRQINDPVTGTIRTEVDPVRVSQFVDENKDLLDRMGLTAVLKDATQAQNALELVRRQDSKINRDLRNQLAFSRLLDKGDNPVEAVEEALRASNPHPVRDFSHLAQLAKGAARGEQPDQAAIDGLKSLVFEYAYRKAGGDDNFSAIEYQKILFDPIARDKPSIVNILRNQGLMSQQERDNVGRLLAPMIRIEQDLKPGKVPTPPSRNFIRGAAAIEDAMIRQLGIRAAGLIMPRGPGALSTAATGSSTARELLSTGPMMTMRHVIEEASKDPAFMATLLKRGQSQSESFQLAKKLRSYLISSGLTAVGPEPEEEPMFPPSPAVPPRAEGPMFQGRAAQALRQLPPAPNTRGIPGFGQQGQAGGGGGAPAGAPSQSRAMLQSLFPFDSISAMAAQQQQQQPPQPPPPG
jgi:hypothetical protein